MQLLQLLNLRLPLLLINFKYPYLNIPQIFHLSFSFLFPVFTINLFLRLFENRIHRSLPEVLIKDQKHLLKLLFGRYSKYYFLKILYFQSFINFPLLVSIFYYFNLKIYILKHSQRQFQLNLLMIHRSSRIFFLILLRLPFLSALQFHTCSSLKDFFHFYLIIVNLMLWPFKCKQFYSNYQTDSMYFFAEKEGRLLFIAFVHISMIIILLQEIPSHHLLKVYILQYISMVIMILLHDILLGLSVLAQIYRGQ